MVNIDWESSVQKSMDLEKSIQTLGGKLPSGVGRERELSEIEKEIREFWRQQGVNRLKDYRRRCGQIEYPRTKTEINCVIRLIDSKLKTGFYKSKGEIEQWKKHRIDLIDYWEIIQKRINEEINRMKELINY